MAGDRSELHHLVKKEVVERSGDQRSGCLSRRVVGMDQFQRLRRHAPVPVGVLDHDAVLEVLGPHIFKPLLHRAVVVLDGPVVTEPAVKHVRAGEEGARPCEIVLVKGPVARADVRYAARLVLPVVDVCKPLGIKGVVVEDVGLSIASHSAVAEPPQPLIPLRTVGRHSAVVSPYAPECIVVDLVDHRVRGLETSCHRHLVVHHLSLEITELGSFLQTLYLNETETVVDIFRMPDDRLAVFGYVGVQNLGGTKVGKVEGAIGVEDLGEFHRQGVTSPESFGLDLETAHHVLPHVQDVAVAGLGDGDRFHDVLDRDVRVRLENQLATRGLHQ